MSCSSYRFTITKGLPNTFIFTIKADGSTEPMTIVGGEVFTAYLSKLEDGSVVLTKDLTVENASNGQVRLEISQADTDLLEISRGGKEDRYYVRPSYKLILECKNTSNGDFLAKVHEVYVD